MAAPLDTSSNGPIAQAYQLHTELTTAHRLLKEYAASEGVAGKIDPRLIEVLEHLSNTRAHLRNVRRELDRMAVNV